LGKVKKRMCIPKKNERVFFVESIKLSSSSFLYHYYTQLHFWKKDSLLRSNVNWESYYMFNDVVEIGSGM